VEVESIRESRMNGLIGIEIEVDVTAKKMKNKLTSKNTLQCTLVGGKIIIINFPKLGQGSTVLVQNFGMITSKVK
jgi:hypothetical protein